MPVVKFVPLLLNAIVKFPTEAALIAATACDVQLAPPVLERVAVQGKYCPKRIVALSLNAIETVPVAAVEPEPVLNVTTPP